MSIAQKLVRFAKQHDVEAIVLDNGKIRLWLPYTKNAQLGYEIVDCEPTLAAVKRELGY